MSNAPIFRDFALLALDLRKEQGIRGIKSELNRFSVHIAMADFARKPINEIRPVDVRDWLRAMQQKKAADTRGDRLICDDTVKRSFALVSSIFTCAVERDVIERSPTRDVHVKKRVNAESTKEKWAFLTMPEQELVRDCAAISLADRLAIRFAIATGLRQGEQFNLELQDLHTGPNSPHVTVRYGSPNHLPPKSGKLREVPLFKDGIVAANQWLYELPKFCPDNPRGLVFPSRRGTVRGVGKPLGRGPAFRQALAKAGITRQGPKWHSLRHTAATNLITGVLGRRWSLDEVRVFLGHSSPNVTLRYAHLGADALQAAARETEGFSMAMPIVPAAPDTAAELETWWDQEESVAS
jgi:integrase